LLAAIAIASLGGPATASRLATVILIPLGAAVALGWVEVLRTQSLRNLPDQNLKLPTRYWLLTITAAGTVAALAAQSWFRLGTVIAGGDNAPPAGTAWISRMFLAWAWSGWNLGGPSALQPKLPWAAVLGLIHVLGGSAELAQRVWYTTLFVGAAVAAVVFLLTLGLRPVASLVGSVAYVFSPYVVAEVMPNPVYLATLALLPAVSTVVLLGATGRVRVRTAVVLIAISAPMLGYIYQTPPLLGMVLAGALFTPLLAGCVFGRVAAGRGAFVVILAIPLTLAASAYWVVPSMLQLASVAKDQLATISSWSWTEGRATVLNAMWLNTAWGWSHPEYYPFAPTYDGFPLSTLKFAPAILAFAALAVGHQSSARQYKFGTRLFRLSVVAGTVALLLIILSTGTNPPGNLIFDRLYALPFGWLLREPGRFLMVVDLMYAILIAITVDAVSGFNWQRSIFPAISPPRFQMATASIIALAVIVPGFPLLTGATVPDKRPILPPWHVQLPGYWTEMGTFVDTIPSSGAVLVLPPDDFYQMPYAWGYYGNDEFIRDLISRPVLTPSSQAYITPSPDLLSATDLTAQSILDGNWDQVDHLLRVLGAPLVLVRGDLDTRLAAFYGREFPSSVALTSALEHSPTLDLVHTSGPLKLFALRGVSVPDHSVAPYYATVNTTSPDLRVLSLLPDRAALVSEPPQVGVPLVQEAPPLSEWRVSNSALNWDVVEASGWTYALARLDSQSGTKPLDTPITVTHPQGGGHGNAVVISVPANDDLVDGSFQKGEWAPVINCGNGANVISSSDLNATVSPQGGPTGGPYLRLSARQGSACEVRDLQWQGGPLLITLSVRRVSGALPHVCLWEVGPKRCANLSAIPDTGTWATFGATTVPDAGTTAMQLWLYADTYVPGASTQIDYANVRVLELASLPKLDLIGTPVTAYESSSLIVQGSAYSPNWKGPAGSNHVLVDGLLNGWLLAQTQSFSARYLPADQVLVGLRVSLVALIVTVGLALSLIDWNSVGMRLRRRVSGSDKTRR
jgi:arabinofuranan 3-O-arabinosyltransferase